MAEYKGIMTGIGDMDNDKNIINPELDAYFRSFIVGNEGIISGLSFSIVYSDRLSKGYCLCQGYIGYLPEDIEESGLQNKYIYGKFTVYHDKNKNDEFSIVSSSTPIASTGVDLRKQAGTAYVTLYETKSKKNQLNYPENANHSDETDVLIDGGELGKDVIGYTQDVNDQSDKIATTKFVHDAIDKYINYVNKPNNLLVYTSGDNFVYIKYDIKKKASFVIFEGKRISIGSPSTINPLKLPIGTKIGQLPKGFYPKNPREYSVCRIGPDTDTMRYFEIHINSEGAVILDTELIAYKRGTVDENITLNIGYEIEV